MTDFERMPDDNFEMPIFGLMPDVDFGRVGRVLGRWVSFLPTTPLSRGDHTFEKNRGAAPMLDEQLSEPSFVEDPEVGNFYRVEE